MVGSEHEACSVCCIFKLLLWSICWLEDLGLGTVHDSEADDGRLVVVPDFGSKEQCVNAGAVETSSCILFWTSGRRG